MRLIISLQFGKDLPPHCHRPGNDAINQVERQMWTSLFEVAIEPSRAEESWTNMVERIVTILDNVKEEDMPDLFMARDRELSVRK